LGPSYQSLSAHAKKVLNLKQQQLLAERRVFDGSENDYVEDYEEKVIYWLLSLGIL
jgi:hypothetical protein